MAIRAVYTFIDDDDEYHVYKHHDGYPEGALEFITNALTYSWDLPRFEADEFACGFISANKSQQGGMRLTKHWENHGDLDYRYEISLKDHQLFIRAFIVFEEKEIFAGNLKDMKKYFFNREKS